MWRAIVIAGIVAASCLAQVSPIRGVTDEEIELHFDGNCVGGMTVNQYPLTWAVRITPDQDYLLRAIRYYQWDEPYPTTEIRVYDAGSTTVPGALLHSQPYVPTDTGWNRVELSTQIPITAHRDFWPSVHMDRYPPTPYIGRDAGPIVTSRNFVYVPGYGWKRLEEISGWANTALRAVVETGTGMEEVIGPVGPAAGLRIRPNPVKGNARFSYRLERAASVSLAVYDASGNRVKVVADGRVEPGEFAAYWDCRDERGARVAAGTYLYVLRAGARCVTGRVAVLD